MDTLSRGNRIYFLLFSILFFVYSCHYNNEDNFENTSRDIAKNEYDIVYKSVTDSVKLWASLNFASFDEDKNGFIIDKIICFNSEVNKCVMSISQQDFEQKEYQSTAEYMQFLYGVKIDSIWYYFKGANIVLPREMYQKDVTKPLSFEKLHEIALKEVFSGYLKEKKPIVPFWKFWVKQEYEIDEQYFMKHWNYYGCMQKNNKDEYSQVCSNGMIDSLIMLNVYDNWRDKTERTFMNTKELWEYYYKTKFPL